MGNIELLPAFVRGDIDVLLTHYINDCSEENLVKAIEQLESDGLIDSRKVNTKIHLIEALSVLR